MINAFSRIKQYLKYSFSDGLFSKNRNRILAGIILVLIIVSISILFINNRPSYEELSIELNKGNYLSVIDNSERYFEGNKDDEYIAVLLAKAYIGYGYQVNQTKEYATKALKVLKDSGKNSIQILLTRADAYNMVKNYDGVKLAYNEILKEDPNNFLALLKLGELAELQHDYTGAYKFYTSAVKITDDNYKARLGLLRLSVVYKRYDDVLKTALSLEKKLNDKDLLGSVYEILGIEYARRRDFKNAKTKFENALKLDPNSRVAIVGAADVHLKTLGQIIGTIRDINAEFRNDIKALNKLIQDDPDYIYSYLVLLDILRIKGDETGVKDLKSKISEILQRTKYHPSELALINARLQDIPLDKVKVLSGLRQVTSTKK